MYIDEVGNHGFEDATRDANHRYLSLTRVPARDAGIHRYPNGCGRPISTGRASSSDG